MVPTGTEGPVGHRGPSHLECLKRSLTREGRDGEGDRGWGRGSGSVPCIDLSTLKSQVNLTYRLLDVSTGKI